MPVLRREKLTKYRVQEYRKNTGESAKGDGRIVRENTRPSRATSRRKTPQSSGSESGYDGRQTGTRRGRKKDEDGPVTRCQLTIADEDWKLWRAVFSSARDEAGLTILMSKENIELLLTRGGRQDAYGQRLYDIPGRRKAQLAYSVDFSEQRLVLLALRIKMKGGGAGARLEERVATRTSIAHHRRTGRSVWLPLMFCPESRIRDVTVDLLRDLPEDDEISFHEYPLRIAQKRREARKLGAEFDALMEWFEGQELLLEEKMREIGRLKERMGDVGEGSDNGALKDKVGSLEGEVKKLRQANLVLETEKRALKRKVESSKGNN